MLNPRPRLQTCALLPLCRSPLLTVVLLVDLGCANVAGFDDFRGQTGGSNYDTSTGTGFQLPQGGTSNPGGTMSTGGTTAYILSAGGTTTASSTATGGAATGGAATGGAETGGAATGGASSYCGALNQNCCTGQTCTGSNTVCNPANNTCEACGATSQRCCNAAERCADGCCVSNRCVAVEQSCGGFNNTCEEPNRCSNCGREGLACCGQTGTMGSCGYGLVCTSGNCRTQ
jgi:hypothetical protein